VGRTPNFSYDDDSLDLRAALEASFAHNQDGWPPPPRTSPAYTKSKLWHQLEHEVTSEQRRVTATAVREKERGALLRARSRKAKPIVKSRTRLKARARCDLLIKGVKPRLDRNIPAKHHSGTPRITAKSVARKQKPQAPRSLSPQKIAVIGVLKGHRIASKSALKSSGLKYESLASEVVSKTNVFVGEKRAHNARVALSRIKDEDFTRK
jgi:hypothetical protein